MGKHISSKKITRSHTSVIDAALPFLELAILWPEVHKIVLGPIIQGLPPGKTRYKSIPITGGLRVTVRGSATKQLIFIYTRDPDTTSKRIDELDDRNRS